MPKVFTVLYLIIVPVSSPLEDAHRVPSKTIIHISDTTKKYHFSYPVPKLKKKKMQLP